MQTENRMPVKGQPFAHQIRAFDFTLERFGFGTDGRKKSNGVALLMEMGCGKTLVGIAVSGFLYRSHMSHIGRVLIVCPLSITDVWKTEYALFADFPYKLTILTGSTDKKKEQILDSCMDTDGSLQILVVNYESAWRLEKELLDFKPDLVICDEGHKIKESHTRQSKAMHHLGDAAPWKLLMTGTLITNKELDVFSQYRFVNPNIFGTSFYRFRNTFFEMKGYGNHIPVFKKALTETFLKRMHCIAFRTTKAECLDLPDITEEVRQVELEPKAMQVYRELEKESITQLKNSEVSAVNVLTKLLRLTQITGGFVTDDEGKSICVSTAKLNALQDIIESTVNDGKKLVVIAHFVSELDAIQEFLKKKGIRYSVIRGGIRNRDEQIKDFQSDPSVPVFLGQISAAGLGITLTAASTMCFFSLSYSMSDFEQAKARIHRAGQKENCHYIYLIAKNTVDRKILRSLRNKTDLAKALVDDWRSGRNPFSD